MTTLRACISAAAGRSKLLATASALALAGIIAACDGPRSTEPAAPVDGPNFASVLNEWVVLDPLTIPNPCAAEDPTQPPFVTVSGKFHVHVESDLDLSPGAHLHINSANFKGEGTTALFGGTPTGDDYRGKLSDNTRLRAQELPTGGFATQDQTKFFLINKEGGPDAMNDLIITTRVFVHDGKIQWVGPTTVECGAIDVEA
jgi:hypothetical protein